MKKTVSVILSCVLLVGLLVPCVHADDNIGSSYNGQSISLADFLNVGEGTWSEENGVICSDGNAEWLLLQFNTKIEGNYLIEYDVRQEDVNRNLSITTGFEVNHTENYTTSGLTFEMHNLGLGRLYDTAINRVSETAYGGCNNTYGDMETFSPTDEWIHVKFQRVENKFTVDFYDGTARHIECVLEDYNGGYMVLGANPSRKIYYKNITITDNMDVVADVAEPSYPETVGQSIYRLGGNRFGEWTTDGDWSFDGASMTQSAQAAEERIAYLEGEEIRNFKLKFCYEMLSENGGAFGVAFRKSKPGGSYKGMGHAVLCRSDENGDGLTLIDYITSETAGLDGFRHPIEKAGTIELSCSGNEICVWYDGEQIINIASNAYAFGSLGFFTEGCAVKFSEIEIVSDDLMGSDAEDLREWAQTLTPEDAEQRAEALAEYETLTPFQQSFFAPSLLEKLAQSASSEEPAPIAEEPKPKQPPTWAMAASGAVLLASAVTIIVSLAGRKKGKENENA